MNRFAAGIRVALIIIATVVSVGAFAETQCPGGTAPPCEPIVVTGSRDPVATCEETGTCEDLRYALLLADGTRVERAPNGSTAEDYSFRLFRTLAGGCKKSTETCTEWNKRTTGVGGFCFGQGLSLRTVCIIGSNDQFGRNCPDVNCPVG